MIKLPQTRRLEVPCIFQAAKVALPFNNLTRIFLETGGSEIGIEGYLLITSLQTSREFGRLPIAYFARRINLVTSFQHLDGRPSSIPVFNINPA
jgi:hypothetical protein